MTRPLFRKPQRISITLPYETYRHLIERSGREGRSISNLAAFLLEAATTCAPFHLQEVGDDNSRRGEPLRRSA